MSTRIELISWAEDGGVEVVDGRGSFRLKSGDGISRARINRSIGPEGVGEMFLTAKDRTTGTEVVIGSAARVAIYLDVGMESLGNPIVTGKVSNGDVIEIRNGLVLDVMPRTDGELGLRIIRKAE